MWADFILAIIRQEAQYTLDRLPIHGKADFSSQLTKSASLWEETDVARENPPRHSTIRDKY